MSIEAVHIVVRGRVQGVYYRASARDCALELKLAGWIRNCPDGTVEIHAEGDRQNLDKFIAWCEKGPPAAGVTGLDTTPVAAGGMETFRVR